MMPSQDSSPFQSPQRVFWKEQRDEDAVYSISLKRVRYRSSDSHLPVSPGDEAQNSYLQWETVRVRTIKAGSLAKLVEHLSPVKEAVEEIDPGYLIAFLTTYRTFASTSEVVDLLFERYRLFLHNDTGEKEEVIEGVLRGIVSVFSVWLEHFPTDFDDPPKYLLLNRMLSFVTSEVKKNHRDELSKKIKQRLDKFQITPYEDEDYEFVTFHLPVSSNLNSTDEDDMCPIQEESTDPKVDLLTVKPAHCAEQLTSMDAKLFKKVVAWHCVGGVWGKKKKAGRAPTVKATVDQFNAVSLRVISSILTSSNSKSSGPNTRGKYISWWINVAQECRDLKNFSSLKAILSGLQSAPIHRLKRSWSHVSRDSHSLYSELSNICSEESNQQSSREILMKEGTAKWAQLDSTSPTKKLANLKRRRSKFMDLGIIQGTVPYLGTFLTDLMMLDAAHPDMTEDGYINFEKRRKEFELITQIKLFQEAAKNYSLAPDEAFRQWFDNIKTFSESESYKLSCKVEETELKLSKRKTCTRIRRMLSEPDISKLNLMTQLTQNLAPPPAEKQCKSNENSPVLACRQLTQNLAPPPAERQCKSNENSPVPARRHQRNNSGSSSSSTSSGVSSCSDTASSSSVKPSSLSLPRGRWLPSTPTSSSSSSPRFKKIGFPRRSLPLTPDAPPSRTLYVPHSPINRAAHAGCIIRVSIEGMEDQSSDGVIYRGIWLADDERTPAVIRSCLEKREMNGDPSEYILVQILSDGTELVIPDNANVYYALNSNVESLLFKLKKKRDQDPTKNE